MDTFAPLLLVIAAIGGGIGLYSAALALGIRHGVDWDHIAAITDITSASSSTTEEKESWLIGEPGVMLTDESHHLEHGPHAGEEAHAGPAPVAAGPVATAVRAAPTAGQERRPARLGREQSTALWLGTLYALGHGVVVTFLGLLAIIASEILPDWVDAVMERVVGVTLLFLAAYLFYSLYRYFRGGEDFRIRSRWMLVFSGVANAWHWVRSRIGHHEHKHVTQGQYSAGTAFGIGLIHGVGAETGTQALIIASAVGATSKTVAVATLLVFVCGLLISNSLVTFATTAGFVSARRRQAIYIAAGLIAAVFSLVLGLIFVGEWTGVLPNLDQYVRWIGGPE